MSGKTRNLNHGQSDTNLTRLKFVCHQYWQNEKARHNDGYEFETVNLFWIDIVCDADDEYEPLLF